MRASASSLISAALATFIVSVSGASVPPPIPHVSSAHVGFPPTGFTNRTCTSIEPTLFRNDQDLFVAPSDFSQTTCSDDIVITYPKTNITLLAEIITPCPDCGDKHNEWAFSQPLWDQLGVDPSEGEIHFVWEYYQGLPPRK